MNDRKLAYGGAMVLSVSAARLTEGGEVGDEVADIFVPEERLGIHGCAGVAAFDRVVAVFVVL